MKYIISAVLLILLCTGVQAQADTVSGENLPDLSVPDYDKYCTIMGGDSLRYNNGLKATGFFKDYYPSGALKHKGYYENGKIATVYTNYYENGEEERSFKSKTDRKGILEVYYPDGNILSRVEWNNGDTRMWQDYYPSGQVEFEEEFNKGLEYYLYMRFFYEDGKPQVAFELTDVKTRTYNYKEFYPNGQVKEEGTKLHNESLGDYQMEGKWSYYNEAGKLLLEEYYTKGQLYDDKKYE